VKLTYAEVSHTGLRARNEDFVLFWQPDGEQERDARGAIALLADGVGGQGDGELASRLAVTTAVDGFRNAEAEMTSNQLLWRLFNEANLAVYDARMHAATPTRMATQWSPGQTSTGSGSARRSRRRLSSRRRAGR